MLSYTALFGLFVLTSILLSNALILLARYVRQVQQPPKDEDFEKLLEEKSALETQLAQDQRSLANLKSTVEQLETDIATRDNEITVLKAHASVAPAPAAPQS